MIRLADIDDETIVTAEEFSRAYCLANGRVFGGEAEQAGIEFLAAFIAEQKTEAAR